MRKFLGVIMVALATLIVGPVQAADFPDYPTIDVPEVDYGLSGSYYLRGSVGLNAMTATDVTYTNLCACSTTVSPITAFGYGYSVGAGFGYETGDGLRGDLTVDYLSNSGMSDGTYSVALRSTIGLVNAYYDFNFGGGYGSAAGGFGGYVGAGLGVAYNQTAVTGGAGAGPNGANWAPVGALMAGVTYDMGTVVTDLGYRMLYTPQITNGSAAMLPAATPYYINNAVTHELRGTVRYRFN